MHLQKYSGVKVKGRIHSSKNQLERMDLLIETKKKIHDNIFKFLKKKFALNYIFFNMKFCF